MTVELSPLVPARARITVPELRKYKERGQRITVLCAYDAAFARLLDGAGIDIVLVGDSLGMTFQGQSNTLGVTMDQMIYHAQAVRRGVSHAHLVVDMPFMSYQASLEDGLRNAGRLIQEGGAESVKIEGGKRHTDLIERLTEIGIPVMGHIGMTPQSIHAMGGFPVQGRKKQEADALKEDALAVQKAGAYAVVLESIPTSLAAEITRDLDIPTIGIGAGVHCDGQVLVAYDLLGMNPDFSPKFVKRYDQLSERITSAAQQFIEDVRQARFPEAIHGYSDRTIAKENDNKVRRLPVGPRGRQ